MIEIARHHLKILLHQQNLANAMTNLNHDLTGNLHFQSLKSPLVKRDVFKTLQMLFSQTQMIWLRLEQFVRKERVKWHQILTTNYKVNLNLIGNIFNFQSLEKSFGKRESFLTIINILFFSLTPIIFTATAPNPWDRKMTSHGTLERKQLPIFEPQVLNFQPLGEHLRKSRAHLKP